MSKRTKILLLDDQFIDRSLLAEGLEEYYDFDVRKVESLAAARQALEEFEPDLLLLDLVVSDDRLEVIQWVKQLRREARFKRTPVLFVTAHYKAMMEHVEGVANAAILKKPFDFEDATGQIRKLLGKTQ